MGSARYALPLSGTINVLAQQSLPLAQLRPKLSKCRTGCTASRPYNWPQATSREVPRSSLEGIPCHKAQCTSHSGASFVVFRVNEKDSRRSRGQHRAFYRAICCYSRPRQCCNSNTTLAKNCALGLLVQSRSEQETECLFVVIVISSFALKALTLKYIPIRSVSKMPAYFSTSRSSHSNTSSSSTNTHYNTCNHQHVYLLSHLR
jgi:hypothetical protein